MRRYRGLILAWRDRPDWMRLPRTQMVKVRRRTAVGLMVESEQRISNYQRVKLWTFDPLRSKGRERRTRAGVGGVARLQTNPGAGTGIVTASPRIGPRRVATAGLPPICGPRRGNGAKRWPVSNAGTWPALNWTTGTRYRWRGRRATTGG